MLDFSTDEGMKPLSRLVRAINAHAERDDFLLAGAQARNLLLQPYKIDPARKTDDYDFAVRVSSWPEFERVRKSMLTSGEFKEIPRKIHKLKFRGITEIDLLPFGEIERPDRTIAWPPDQDTVMTMSGFAEAYLHRVTAKLPEDQSVSLVSLPALAVLKFAAWGDRRRIQPGKDAKDLALIMDNYLEAGQRDRLYRDFSHLVADPDFDDREAGGYLLGWDMGQILNGSSNEWLRERLRKEADEDGQLQLVGDLGGDPEMKLRMIKSVQMGFESNTTPEALPFQA